MLALCVNCGYLGLPDQHGRCPCCRSEALMLVGAEPPCFRVVFRSALTGIEKHWAAEKEKLIEKQSEAHNNIRTS